MRRRVGFLVAAVVAAVLVAAPAAMAETQVASSGQVKATLSFTPGAYGQDTNFHLAIDRAGQRLYDAKLDVCCQALGKKAVHARDLDGDGEPEVWVDIYTGGAHCCTDMELFRYANGAYARQTRTWDQGYRLKDLDGDGIPEFRTADDRLAYVFTYYAASPFPVRVLSYRAGTFTNVTARFPALVRKDLRVWRNLYRRGIRHHTPSLGALAGWTADDYVLGRRKQANRRLTRELHAGRLYADPGYAGGRKYIRHLKRALRRAGY